ncbi:MAG: hypothetical protein AAB445_01345 [Patescibacteria group bacterium]
MQHNKHQVLRRFVPTYPAPPVLDVGTLRTALKPYRALTSQDGVLGEFMDRNYLSAEKELIARCVTADIGERLLEQADLATLTDAMQICTSLGFPDARQAHDEIVAFATSLPEVPTELYSYENLVCFRRLMLNEIGVNFVRSSHGLPGQPKIWDRDAWSTYFAKHPCDAFRITVLATAQHLHLHDPAMVTSRIHMLFPTYFPMDYFPAGETLEQQLRAQRNEKDPDEPWKR